MEIIKYFGAIIAENLQISPPAARGLIKLAIKDRYGPFKPLEQLTFNDYKEVLKNEVKTRLETIEINNIDELISRLINFLIENQSIITLGEV
ncbi:MAG: hypothetical protein ACFFD1_10250 [Candidatus Thorarchaeota archaeon]